MTKNKMAATINPQPTTHKRLSLLYRNRLVRFAGLNFLLPIISPHNKVLFLKRLPEKAKILDVGCGNQSIDRIKSIRPDVYYVGIDVSDCNNDELSKGMADEYIQTDGERFAESIRNLPGEFDAVISSHNLEHCNHPMETLDAICSRLKKGGRLYLSFPCEDSVTFPSREGTLNFYDDETHIYVPDFKAVMKRLVRDNGMYIDFAARSYKPFFGWLGGMIINFFSKNAMRFIWYYYGFESVITAHKK